MSRLLITASALIIVSSSCFAVQNAGKAVNSDFQARYDALTKAFLRKDLIAAGRFLAPDYSAGSPQRPLDKNTTLDELRRWDGRFRTVSRHVASVIVNRDKASATIELVTEGKITDKAGVHKIVIKAQCLDTWQKNLVGWQLKHSHILRSSTLFDGKAPGAIKQRRK